LQLVEKELARAAPLVGKWRRRCEDTTPLEEPEVSGIAGSGMTAVFSHGVARHLCERHRGEVCIDWDAFDTQHRLGLVLSSRIPLLAEDAEVEAHPPYRRWVEAAAKGDDLGWLLRNVPSPSHYDLLEVPLRWDFGDGPATRTRMRLPGRRVFCHRGPLIRRSDVTLADIAQRDPLSVRRLSRREGQKMMLLARDTLAVRYRELHGFTWGDPRFVDEVDAGRGLRFFFSGVPPEHRLPLRAYHAATMWKNGVPIGYFEGLTLCERMEAGFNLFYTFREGETAWVYSRLLQACHQLLGVTCFFLEPYQVGHENEEAIESGAFWFYRKLGYRSVDGGLRELTAREERKIAARPEYRTPERILRRLVRRPMVYELPGTERGAWDNFEVRNVGFAAVKKGLGRVLAGIERALRKKAEPEETSYVRLLQRDTRLRAALLLNGL
jgi:hypothetical protein